MWYAKMYFYGKLERFEYDAAGVQERHRFTEIIRF